MENKTESNEFREKCKSDLKEAELTIARLLLQHGGSSMWCNILSAALEEHHRLHKVYNPEQYEGN